MPNRRKFSEGQKRKWQGGQQASHYASAANQAPPKRSREEEAAAIAAFIRDKGVKRIPTPREAMEAKRREAVPEVSLPDDEEIPA